MDAAKQRQVMSSDSYQDRQATTADAGTVASELQQTGIINPDDRFQATSSVEWLSRLDPERAERSHAAPPESRQSRPQRVPRNRLEQALPDLRSITVGRRALPYL
jgi:hypothetical protein